MLNRFHARHLSRGLTYKPLLMGLAGIETGKAHAGHGDPGRRLLDFGSHLPLRPCAGARWIWRAIQHSSNVYFYTLANEMGVDAIHDFMKPLGFGRITGIDLPGEVRGVLPSKEGSARPTSAQPSSNGLQARRFLWVSARATTTSPSSSSRILRWPRWSTTA